ncbi:MAG: flavodoxin-dependent (E)-4-hydroxy-3-methylbut-2-enyl-diphosphate synthase [Clostridium sp.]|nr:flavodoxin-dependent (E)-4-hydroxy-3-methylbut-2-enyl-diphosphate synthase [Clostridium sp.]
MIRKETRKIKVKDIYIGGDSPVSIQSMTNTDTRDAEKTIEQIRALMVAGVDIIRVAVPDMEAAEALKEITKAIPIPVVADIHFDYKLALKAIDNGISKLRINPGNIGGKEKIDILVQKCIEKDIPIRIGINSGSLEEDIFIKYKKVTPEALVESAMRNVRLLEKSDFHNIIISIKSSDVLVMMESYRLLAKKVDYPLHLGVTEAGTPYRGTIKSSIGIGGLLSEGLGDTIRVSLTGDPIEEVRVAREILKATGHKKDGIEFVSCPTCGRTEINLIKIANEVEQALEGCKKNIKVAVMGCVVNGPGEAREADIGVAGGKGSGVIFKKGKIIRKVKEDEIVKALLDEIENM